MARTRTRSTIEEKIEAQKLIVSKAKDKYEAAVNELERLMKLRDEEHRKELLKHIAASKRSYDEIIAFLDGNAYNLNFMDIYPSIGWDSHETT